MNIALLIPPSIDWNMPLIALPLLKAYLPEDWDVKIIDINAKLFSTQFKNSALVPLKKKLITAIESKNLLCAVDTFLSIEDCIASKSIGSANLHGRGLNVIDEWFDSHAVYEYLQNDSELISVLSNLLADNLVNESINVFGISISVEEQIVPSFIICSILRKNYPKAKIILGGNIISRLYSNILKSSLAIYFDLLIVGEGEPVLESAIRLLMAEEHTINKVFVTSEKSGFELFQNLKTPDFKDICWNDYVSPFHMLPITAQRKCKWSKCDFCAIHSCWTYGIRDRNVANVVDEIEELIKNYNTNYFRIVDEMVCAEYLHEFSQLLLKRNIKINFEAYVRFEDRYTDEAFIKTIFEGGCRQLFWGLENINDEALKLMNKGTNKALIEKCLRSSSNSGITNYCFILMGIPGISQATERETINFASNNFNIQVGVVGSFVVDRLSPMHFDEAIQSKYGITLFEIGDLTTEIGYLQNGIDRRQANKLRTSNYIIELYKKRPDYAICSLLSEEARLVLTATFGNKFAFDYVASISEDKMLELVKRSTAHLIEERVTRRVEEV